MEWFLVYKGYGLYELIATFFYYEEAKDFVNYKATYESEAYTVANVAGEKIYPERY